MNGVGFVDSSILENHSYVSVSSLGIHNDTEASDKTADQTRVRNEINDFIKSNTKYNIVIIPPDVDYGYKRGRYNRLEVMDSTIRLFVFDYSKDESYSSSGDVGEKAAQFRIWTNTPTSSAQHDGNTVHLKSNQHPSILLSSLYDENITTEIEGETVPNNNRTSIMFATDSNVKWKMSKSIYGYDESFNITKFHGSNSETVFCADYDTNHITIGGSSTPFELGVFRSIVQITSTPAYFSVRDSYQNYSYQLQKQADSTGIKVYFTDSNGNMNLKLRYLLQSEVSTIVYTSKGMIETSYNPTRGFSVSNIGRTVELFNLPNEGIFRMGVSGNHVSSANRPLDVSKGTMTFDDTLNIPIWFNGTDWIDSQGNVV